MGKVAQFLLVAWLLLTLNFALPRLMPGAPLADLADPQGSPIPLTREARTRILAYYGLDRPVAAQYWSYLAGLARGDLGWSIGYNAPVSQVLGGRLRWTLQLVGVATLAYLALGVVLGALSAWNRGHVLDRMLLVTTFTVGAFPAFFLAMLLILLFGVKLRWLPLGGARSVTAVSGPWALQAADVVRRMLLPASTLVLTNLADVYYLARNSLGQVLGAGYIAMARAKGLPEHAVLFRHALPNALLPMVALAGLRLGATVMGSTMVEVAFAYPGIGLAIYEACVARDYPLLQGAFLVTTLSVMLANLLADGLCRVLDPRLRRTG